MKTTLFIALSWFGFYILQSQELKVEYFDENDSLVNTETMTIGDFVVVKHATEGNKPHYFQGKITGLFKDRNEVRVFDYARSERVMPLVGKKIKLSEIMGISRANDKKSEGRENRAVVGKAATALGSLAGGAVGNTLSYGSAFGTGISDGLSREKIDTQNVKCEIIE